MTEPATARPEHSRGLDVLRGAAAVLVVLGHARGDLFAVRGLDPRGSGVLRVVLAPTSFAQESVAVFFVLSGYLVGGQVLRQVRTQRFDWRVYLTKRLSRLWTVLIPGLLLTAVVDALTSRIDSAAKSSLQAMNATDVATELCNTAFLMPTRCVTYGSNESLWSLAYEFWFYVLFAGGTVAWYAARRGRVALACVNLAVGVGTVALFGVELLSLFPAWLIGVLIAQWRVSRPSHRHSVALSHQMSVARWTGAGMLLAAAFLASNTLQPPDAIRTVAVAAATAPLVWLCLEGRSERSRPWLAAGERLGSWSYSIYVFHRPLVALVAVASRSWWGADARVSAAALYAVAAVVIAAIYPLYLLTERHTDAIRAVALRLTSRSARPRSAAAGDTSPG